MVWNARGDAKRKGVREGREVWWYSCLPTKKKKILGMTQPLRNGARVVRVNADMCLRAHTSLT